MSRVKTLWVREPYLSYILAGRKTVEVRVGYDNIRRLQPGDRLKLNDAHEAVITRVGRYPNFDELLAHEDASAIAPDLPADELLPALRALYPPDKEALGAVALELALPEPGGRPETVALEDEPLPPNAPPAGGAARRYDAVLFDMGYTLVYFEPVQPVIVREALRVAGVERSLDDIQAAAGASWRSYYRDAATATFPATEEYDRRSQWDLSRLLLARLGVEDEAVARAYVAALDARFEQPGVLCPYPEVREVLGRLRAAGYRLGIISNWSWNLRRRVEQAGLEGYFELTWASAYAGCNKPHPAIFRQALERMGIPAARALYVGDSYEHDVLGARAAGLDVVLIDRSPSVATAASPPPRDCPVIADLRNLLTRLLA